MGKRARLRIIATFFQLIAAAAPLAVIAFPTIAQKSPIGVRILVSPSLFCVFSVLYNNWPWFYLWVTRARLWISNANVDWTISMDVEGHVTPSSLDEIIRGIRSAYSETKIWASATNDRVVRLPFGGALRFQLTTTPAFGDEDAGPLLAMQLTDFHVPFRSSNEILEKLGALIQDKILSAVRGGSEKYTLKIRFPGTNPYYGLFVRQLSLSAQDLMTFECQFEERVGHKRECIQVSKDRIILTTDSLTSLQALAGRYITLAMAYPQGS